MRYLLIAAVLILPCEVLAQESASNVFWQNLLELCDKAYSGEVLEAPADDEFRTQTLVMHVRSCEENEIRIPFFVGEDRSRTWVLTKKNERIQLKHDHRHKDGSEDEITMYGGTSVNTGLGTLQTFPADQHTTALIPAAASNIWWIEIVPDQYFTYNLRRIGTDRYFSIRFHLKDEVDTPEAPWGWE